MEIIIFLELQSLRQKASYKRSNHGLIHGYLGLMKTSLYRGLIQGLLFLPNQLLYRKGSNRLIKKI